MFHAFVEATKVFLIFCLVVTIMLFIGMGLADEQPSTEDVRTYRALIYVSGAVGAYGTGFITYLAGRKQGKKDNNSNE